MNSDDLYHCFNDPILDPRTEYHQQRVSVAVKLPLAQPPNTL